MEDSELHTQRLLGPLWESIVDKPPYTSGTLRLPTSCFSLFYKANKDGNDTRHINLANATHDELEHLVQACDPAIFGLENKKVLDQTYHKAGRMGPDRFASPLHPSQTDLIKIIHGHLLEGTHSSEYVVAELHELNVHSKGSFIKPHADTPQSQKMFGSLVIVFPIPHEGGALLLRHRGKEWAFESNQGLVAAHEPSIGYVAFFRDVEHEVAQVTSGHRVTLTYNLYYDDGGRAISSGGATSKHLSLPPAVNKNAFRKPFQALLEDPEFLPYGGTLVFDMRHIYPIPNATDQPNPLGPIYGALKGSDAVVYHTARALGFQPVLYMHHQSEYPSGDHPMSAVSETLIDFSNRGWPVDDDFDFVSIVLDHDGIAVRPGCENDYTDSEQVEWVTPGTMLNFKMSPFMTDGYDPSLGLVYSELCMFVRIGAAGERLEYPSLSQLKKERERERERERAAL